MWWCDEVGRNWKQQYFFRMNLKCPILLQLFFVVSCCGSAQSETSARAISIGGFSGAIFYNRIPSTNPEHFARPDVIHTQGFILRYSASIKRKMILHNHPQTFCNVAFTIFSKGDLKFRLFNLYTNSSK